MYSSFENDAAMYRINVLTIFGEDYRLRSRLQEVCQEIDVVRGLLNMIALSLYSTLCFYCVRDLNYKINTLDVHCWWEDQTARGELATGPHMPRLRKMKLFSSSGPRLFLGVIFFILIMNINLTFTVMIMIITLISMIYMIIIIFIIIILIIIIAANTILK